MNRSQAVAPQVSEVIEFDQAVGLGTLAGGVRFHLIEIVDGTRSIEVGQRVAWLPKARFGTLEASQLVKLVTEPAVEPSSSRAQ